ncbi:unnamed protein product [Brachionus calyciflorus]|uniref:Glycosyltransferase 61 catalytic domain-containing protein n=1 Tax=Brachionus calyciflorus TaxID=104777 RepID=A0A813WCM0_9BILA|nr:unnamed protein product [Brachionus calyciflorus]
MSFLEQINLISQTKLLIGIHGPSLTNIAFLPPEAVVIELITSRSPFYTVYDQIAIKSGHYYYRFLCDWVETATNETIFECLKNKECNKENENYSFKVDITKFSFVADQVKELL